MSSRDSILRAIRAQTVPPADQPSLEHTWLRYADPQAQFQSLVESVGGRIVRLASQEDLAKALDDLPEYASAMQIVSGVAAIPSTVNLNAIEDPHDLESVDFALFPGQFGVAENGAIWVTDEAIRHRAIYFITQHLALVLPASQIVHNLNEAYARLAIGSSSLGLFISGPSKTADIEQSLVIGAHGPRSLTVFLVDDKRS